MVPKCIIFKAPMQCPLSAFVHPFIYSFTHLYTPPGSYSLGLGFAKCSGYKAKRHNLYPQVVYQLPRKPDNHGLKETVKGNNQTGKAADCGGGAGCGAVAGCAGGADLRGN